MSKMVNFARLQVGKPYDFGKSGPDSFDCSGLTKRAVAQIGLDFYHGATTQWNRGTATGPSVSGHALEINCVGTLAHNTYAKGAW